MRYLIYCRRSSEDTKQSQSLETQLNILNDFVVRNDLVIVDKIVESKSAKEDGLRSGFTELLDRIAKGDADGILVAHIDRLSRNGTDSAKLTKLLTSGKLKEIRTPSKVYDTSKDILMMEIELAMAAEYSRNLSIRIKEGNANKLRKGGFIGWAPIGYLNHEGAIVPDPKRAPHVVAAFTDYATGGTPLSKLSLRLYLDGFRSRAGVKVAKSQVHRLLTNPTYAGLVPYGGTTYKGVHKPLISRALFDRVQAVLHGVDHSKKQTHDFLYRPYLRCGSCGCQMTASLKKGKYRYYYCTNGKKVCDQHRSYLDESDICELVRGNFANIPIDKKLLNLAFDYYTEKMSTSSENIETRKLNLQEQIKNVQKRLDKLVDLHIEGEIDKETFNNKRSRLNGEIAELEQALATSNPKSVETTLELVKNWKNTVSDLETLFVEGDDLVKSDLLKSVLWNFSIKDKIIANHQYKLPFAYLEKMPKNAVFDDWLPG